MSIICIIGTALYVLALVCGLLSRRRAALSWASCMLGVVCAGLMLYDGASMETLAAGALVLALPLLSADHGAEREAP